MEKRNFNILIVSAVIGLTISWLSVYNIVRLGINPFEYIQNQIFGVDDDDIVITITGPGVNQDLELSLNNLKSDSYLQISNQIFSIENAFGSQFEITYSGVSLWSVLEISGILKGSATTFRFIGYDGYQSEHPLSLTIAQTSSSLIILAYAEDGHPLFNDGPIRSVINQSAIPSEISSHYWVQNLARVYIA